MSLLTWSLEFGRAGRRNGWSLAALVLAASHTSPPTPTIETDKADYPPGHTVTFTGHGWAAGERVTIVLERDPPVHDDEVLVSIADTSGNIRNTDFAPADYDLGVRFQVTATGRTSGLQARTTFTDGAVTWTGLLSNQWNNPLNWSSLLFLPGANDDVTIPANVGSGRYPVLSTAATVKSITLASGGGTQPSLTVSGNTLTVNGNFRVNAGTVTQSGGTIRVTAGQATITGTLNQSGGTFLSSVGMTINSGGNVNVSGAGVFHLATAIGTAPTSNLTIAAGGTLTQSGGIVDVRDLFTTAGAPGGTYGQSGGTSRIYRDFRNSGAFTATAGTIEFAGSGGVDAFNAPGANQFYNVVVNAGVTTNFASTLPAAIGVGANWTNNGTALLTSRATTVTFTGAGAQTIGGASSTTFRNVTINKTAGTVTLARNQAITDGDLSVLAGTLDLSSFTMNRSAGGGTLTVANGATLKIGGTNSFPANYVTRTLGATSTVEYNGTAQTVTAESYGHLTLSGSGTKTMPGTAMTIAGNFTMSGTATATAAQALTVNGGFTIGSGASFGGASFSHQVKGNFSNSGAFTGGTSTFSFNGTSPQTIGGSVATSFNELTINNATGVALSGVDASVAAVLTFTSGLVTTGPRVLSVGPAGTVSRTSGHVVGNLRKHVATGATSRTFEVGDAGNYTPVTVAFASVTTAGDLTASTTAGDHPNITSGTLNAAKSVNRFWSLSNSGVAFTSYSATFTFVVADVDAGATTSGFIVGKFAASSWSYPTVGTRTATTTQITGATSFSDFQIAEGAYILSGSVFEDVNYGGGAGRSKAASTGASRSGARVELYTSAGAYSTFTTTDGSGNYSFTGVATGTHYVRVVNNSVTSSRTGYTASALAVQTYRADAASGAAVAVTDYVGGTDPTGTDPGNASIGATFNTTTFVYSAVLSGTAQSVSAVSISAASVTGVDFGFNFSTVVNLNHTGQGSLRQFITNANLLGNSGLAQSGLTAGIDNAIWMISNGTAAAGLRPSNNYFSGGIATIAPTSALPAVTDPVILDAHIQPGWTSAPIVELNGTSAGAGVNGLNISAGGSTVRGLVINRFSASGIAVATGGSNTIQGNYIGTNAAGSSPAANGGPGISIATSNNTIGGTTAGMDNLISGNAGVGVLVTAGTGNAIWRNRIYANGSIGIDLGNNGVTANNGTKNGGLPNSDMDSPVFTSVLLNGTTLTVVGYVGSAASQSAFGNARVEIFKSDNHASGFGGGETYLGFVNADANGNINDSISGITGLSGVSRITGTATDAANSTSEFGANMSLGAAAPNVALVQGVTASGSPLPGADLAYTVTFTNFGTANAQSLVLTDSISANTDFKVGSETNNLGSTGLSVVVAYSSDGGSTWIYTPASGAGGAPAGYDRLVTDIRWTFTGSLSQTAPNNTGSTGFTARIR